MCLCVYAYEQIVIYAYRQILWYLRNSCQISQYTGEGVYANFFSLGYLLDTTEGKIGIK